jgi:hypothetical protein
MSTTPSTGLETSSGVHAVRKSASFVRKRLSGQVPSRLVAQRLVRAEVTAAEEVLLLPGAKDAVAVDMADRQLARDVSESRPLRKVEHVALMLVGMRGFAAVVVVFVEDV